MRDTVVLPFATQTQDNGRPWAAVDDDVASMLRQSVVSAQGNEVMDVAASREARRWCEAMLPRVSRTFALNIRILNGEVRQAVLQAYLLCRIADSIEDAEAGQLDKSTCLRQYSTLLSGAGEGSAARLEAVRRWAQHHFGTVVRQDADWELCRNAAKVFIAWESLPRRLRGPIEVCVRDMSLGMADVTARMRLERHGELQIESLQDLESYCHVVAGTVGTMLCEVFLEQNRHLEHERASRMRSLAERFGLALQLVNILQDVQVDRRRGVTYLPRRMLSSHGVTSETVFRPENRSQWVAVLARLVTLALQSCDAAIEFSLLLPRNQWRLRLFCLWPLFLALRTLHQVLDMVRRGGEGQRPRVPRRQVRRCLLRASVRVASNRLVQSLYVSERRRVQRCLHELLLEQGPAEVMQALSPGTSAVEIRSRNLRPAGGASPENDSRTAAMMRASGRAGD
jgi:farnesyl-diphosphate farnesyltransferase